MRIRDCPIKQRACLDIFELYLPVVKLRELVFLLFIPCRPSLEKILVMQSTRNCTSSRDMTSNFLPLHPLASESYQLVVFFVRPFALLFGCRFAWVDFW